MIRRSDTTVFPDGVTPEPGIYVTVKDDTGTLATLYDDVGASKPNPFTSDAVTGAFYYNIADADAGAFLEEYRLSLADAPRTIIAVTLTAFGPSGPIGPTGPAGDIAKVADRTALAAITGMAAGATRYLVEAGREGTFVFSTANLSALVTADTAQGVYVAPASAPTGASGAWARTFDGAVNVEWFGTADAAYTAMEAYLRSVATTGFGYTSGALQRAFTPSGVDAMGSTTIDLYGTGILEGDSSGLPGGGASVLQWSGAVSGIRFQQTNTSGASTAGATGLPGSNASIVRNLFLKGGYSGANSAAHAFHLRAPVALDHNFVQDFPGDGVFAHTQSGAGGALEGNSNCSRISNMWVQGCYNGFHFDGADANAFSVSFSSAVSNRGYGFDDSSFLGGVWIANHAASNTLGGYHSDPAQLGAAPLFIGCYDESGQPTPVFGPKTLRVGGVWGSGGTGGGYIYAEGGFVGAAPGLQIKVTDGAKTLTLTRGLGGEAVASNPLVDDLKYTDFCGGLAGVTSYFRAGTGIYVLNGVAYSVSDINIALNGNAGTRYMHGLSVAPSNALGFREIWLGDGTFPDGRRLIIGTAAPGSGEHARGEIIFDTGVTATTPSQRLCVTSGTPGTWLADYPYPRADPATGIGYVTGAGGAVTQATSKITGVTLNKVCGQITMHNASLGANTAVSFTLTNSAIAATDVIRPCIASGATAGAYLVMVDAVAAGSCQISVRNLTAGALGEAIVLNFSVLKAVAA